MNFLKSTISEKLNSDAVALIKEATDKLPTYFEYYTLLNFENISEALTSFNSQPFTILRGPCGIGKNSFKTILQNCIETSKNIFEYNCSEITELDDIFFSFYKFMLKYPQQKEIFKNPKSNFKPRSIDEQILYYLKRTNGTTILFFDNFDKLLDENGNFKTENTKSFFEFLSTIKDLKVVISTQINVKSVLSLPAELLSEIRLSSVDEDKIKDFFAIFKVDIQASWVKEIYQKTNGHIFKLKLLAIAQKNLDLPISALLKEHSSSNLSLEEYLSKKLIGQLSADSKKTLVYLALFRHPINSNILKSIDNFGDVSSTLDKLKGLQLIEEKNNEFELRYYLKELLLKNLSEREKIKLHEKIANFYSDQIPLKPNERVIELSRTSLYSEKFYHYNIFSKLSKNLELQSSRVASSQNRENTSTNSEKIKYIASTKYIPELEVKSNENQKTESNIEQTKPSANIEIEDNITLSEEEKALLRNDIEIEADTEETATNFGEISQETGFVYNQEFEENTQEIQKEDDELTKGKNLLQKGQEYYKEGRPTESMGYLKNAMAILQDKDFEKFCIAKLTLAKAQLENFRNYEAIQQLNELLSYDLIPEIRTDALIELASLDEYNNQKSEAIKKLNEALKISEKNRIKTHSAKVYFKLALIYDDINDTEKALYNYLLAATDATDINDRSITASAFSNIAAIYQEKNDLQKAVEYHKKSLAEDELANNFEGQAKTLASLGEIFLSKNKTNLAIKIFIRETQVAKKTNDKYLIASSYLELGDTFLAIQDYKNALKAYFLSKKNIDSTISTDSKNKIERRFEMIVDEIGENAYNFLVKELRKK